MVSDPGLQALLDERAIIRLLHEYGHTIDYGLKAAWIDLFTPDACYVLRYRAGLVPRSIGTPEQVGGDWVYRGGSALAAFIAAHSHAPDRWHKHLVANWRIDLAGDQVGDRASVASYFTRTDATDAGARIVAAGRYLDTVVRGEDGRWRFAERIAEIEMQ